MEWTAVTFTTPEYEHFAPRWEEMIRSLGGTPIVTRMTSTGDWARNTGLKPAAILDAWRHLTTDWFLYLDIDILLREAPAAPTGTWDVGVVENRDMSHKNRISAGSLIFRKTAGSLHFLQQWNARCRQRPGKDHDAMAKTISLAKATRRPLVQDITGAIDWVPNGLRTLPETPEPTAPIILAMATFPPRKEGMLRVLQDLLPQCDKFYLYLNGYDEVPEGLPESDKLQYILAGPSSGNPDKGSQGKFHWAGLDDGYYLTVDDDIFYPEDYASYMSGSVEYYGRSSIVGLHGGIFSLVNGRLPAGIPHARRRKIDGYDRAVERDKSVHTLGGGVMACYPQHIGLTANVCSGPLHSGDDEDLAVWAQKNEIPMIRLQGKDDWVTPNATEWVKDPLHRRTDFIRNADIKIKAWSPWVLQPLPEPKNDTPTNS